MKKSTNVNATCNPVYVVEHPFGSSSWSRACQARGISPHADRSLHSLNNVVHAGECKAAISAMCTKPADGGGKRAGFQRLRPETCQKSHEKALFLCSNCTEKEVGGCDTWVGGIVPQSRLGVFIAMVSAFRHPKDTRYVFPARFAQVKHTMTGNLSPSRRPSRCA